MPTLKSLLLLLPTILLLLLLSTVLEVSAKERFRVKFFTFQGRNCEKEQDGDGTSIKADRSEYTAECHPTRDEFDGFMYYWQEHHFRGQSGSMEFGKCQIVVYRDMWCKTEPVYILTEANLRHNFEMCADFQGRKGGSYKIWCEEWPGVGTQRDD